MGNRKDGVTLTNEERPHQSLGYQTPASVYRSGAGGGALIADRYGGEEVAALAAD